MSATQRNDIPTDIAKPVRPIEFSLWILGPFASVLIALAIVLTVLFTKAHMQGTILHDSWKLVVIDLYRLTASFEEYNCAKHPRELHSHGNSYTH
jgi:UDP-N-acetylglucosamine:LPS N-acetylglucosamine transferase